MICVALVVRGEEKCPAPGTTFEECGVPDFQNEVLRRAGLYLQIIFFNLKCKFIDTFSCRAGSAHTYPSSGHAGGARRARPHRTSRNGIWQGRLKRTKRFISYPRHDQTLAFILPACVHINAQAEHKMGEGPIALILAPTRYDFLFLLVSLFLCVSFIFVFFCISCLIVFSTNN